LGNDIYWFLEYFSGISDGILLGKYFDAGIFMVF